MIYYIIIYILRRGRRGRQQDKKTTRQQDRTLRFYLESISRNGSKSHIFSDSMAQVFDKTKRQKDNKTVIEDLQISLQVDIQECVKKSHF